MLSEGVKEAISAAVVKAGEEAILTESEILARCLDGEALLVFEGQMFDREVLVELSKFLRAKINVLEHVTGEASA